MLHLFRAVKLLLALRKSDDLPTYLKEALSHPDPAVASAAKKQAATHLERLRQQRERRLADTSFTPGDSLSFTHAAKTHGRERAHLHEAGCRDPRCPGGADQCITDNKFRAPESGERVRDYSDFIPEELRFKGYGLKIHHRKRDQYEEIEGVLSGPGIKNAPSKTGSPEEGYEDSYREGVWQEQRRIPEKAHKTMMGEQLFREIGSWPSHGAVSGNPIVNTSNRRTKAGRALNKLFLSVTPHVHRALHDYVKSNGGLIAEDDPHKYYSHAPKMLRFFKR